MVQQQALVGFWRPTNTLDKEILEFDPEHFKGRCILCWKFDESWEDHRASTKHQIRAHYIHVWNLAAEASGEQNWLKTLEVDLVAWESSGVKKKTAFLPRPMNTDLSYLPTLVQSWRGSKKKNITAL